jgi:hypothetical protein
MQTVRRHGTQRPVGREAASIRSTRKGILTHSVSRRIICGVRQDGPPIPPLGPTAPKRKPMCGGRKVVF